MPKPAPAILALDLDLSPRNVRHRTRQLLDGMLAGDETARQVLAEFIACSSVPGGLGRLPLTSKLARVFAYRPAAEQ